jgi:hypothetical protein
MNVRKLSMIVLGAALMAAPATFSSAQDQPSAGGQNNAGGERRGRGNFNPEEFRVQMEARMKERLGVNDDEWKVIQPKMEKVTTAQRDARGFGGGFGGGRDRGRGGQGGGAAAAGGAEQRQESPVAKASSELRATLDKKDASADEINAKLTALRDARAKAKADLETAQKELKEVLTARQEAVFVSMGMLE